MWRSSLARACTSRASTSSSSSSVLLQPRWLSTSAWNNPNVSVPSEEASLSSLLSSSSSKQQKNAGDPLLETLALSHHHAKLGHQAPSLPLLPVRSVPYMHSVTGVEQRTTDMMLDALFSRQIPLPYGITSCPSNEWSHPLVATSSSAAASVNTNTTARMEMEPITTGMQWWLLDSDVHARRVTVSIEEDEDNDSTISVPTLEMMNRNARRGKKANHGKRPCSRVARRSKKIKIGRRPRR